MMKVLIIADNHFCTKSSVINGRGEKYSDRIENQIKSFKWAESFELPIIHLGDLTDRSTLTAEEIEAFTKEVKPSLSRCIYMLLGNHEYSGDFDTLGISGCKVIRRPTEVELFGKKILFLPFNSTEGDIKGNYDIIMGHLGLKDIPFGAKGLDFNIIDKHCKMFLNGHLHNRLYLGENKWNVGSLTAQNFSDDCIDYRKGAVILDLDDLTLEFVENPYAYNFFKFTWNDYLNKYQRDIDLDKAIRANTSCISMSCKEGQKKEILTQGVFKDTYYLRITEEVKSSVKVVEDQAPVTLDHIGKFRTSFIERQKDNPQMPLVLEELGEVFRG